MFISVRLKNKLLKQPDWLLSVYAAVCSFGIYFCMYAFRKPFTAASFAGLHFFSIDFKVALVIAQVIGYMLSKFYGIRFISSIGKEKRAATILMLILLSWLALLLFAVVPSPYNIVFMLLNGFPLGMVWGLVFSFIEGRRGTEFMGAVLSVSFIFSSGAVKSTGKFVLLHTSVSEFWMPFVTGAIFLVPLLLFTWLLNHYPPPTAEDSQRRSPRLPMNARERKEFLVLYLPGILLVITTYVLLTILRDFRDNFANELWTELGYGKQASIFSDSETPVSLIVLGCMSLLVLVRNNFKAFMINHLIVCAGYLVALAATILFTQNKCGPLGWMIGTGTGLYLSYVPFNCLYFERMIATYRIRGNVGFIMYVADSFGYLGSVAVLLIKELLGVHMSWTSFFVRALYMITGVGIAGTIAAVIYFKRKYQNHQTQLNLQYAA